MSRPINGSNKLSLFEKDVEDEWKTCVYKLNRIRSYDTSNFYRYETIKKYWEDRLKALALVAHKEKVGWKNNVSWLKILEAKYPSGIDWRNYLSEVQ
jgi:hypothetical protein